MVEGAVEVGAMSGMQGAIATGGLTGILDPINLFPLRLVQLIKRPLLATLGMAMVTYFFRDNNIIFNVLISAIVYFVFLILLKVMGTEEIAITKSIVRGYTAKFLDRFTR